MNSESVKGRPKKGGGSHTKKQYQKPTGKSLKDMLPKSVQPADGKGRGSHASKPNAKRPFNGEKSGDSWKNDGKKRKFSSDHRPGAQRSVASQKPYSNKPNFELVEDLKLSWNVVRDRSTSAQERTKLLQKMSNQMDGHVLQVTLRHDASRIVQCLLQFGTLEQREKVLAELLEKSNEISKTPYGHFTILKAITYCNSAEDKRRIVNSMKGRILSIATNVISSRVVESVLQLYPSSITRPMKAELYGQKFCLLLEEPPASLRALIEQLPTKRVAIMDHMSDLMQRFVNKSLLEFAFVHNLLWEYAQEVLLLQADGTHAAAAAAMDGTADSSSEAVSADTTAACEPGQLKKMGDRLMTELVGYLVDAAPKLLSSKPGARAMCTAITHATAKDRKRIIKSLKGHAVESLLHDSAYLGILRIVDVTDDTVNVQKSLLEEVKSMAVAQTFSATGEKTGSVYPPLMQIALHKNGHKLLLRILLGDTKKPKKSELSAAAASTVKRITYLEPDEEALFAQTSTTSKKPPELRRQEYVVYMRNALLRLCTSSGSDGSGHYMETLLRSRFGARVLEAVILTLRPKSVLVSFAKLLVGLSIPMTEKLPEEEDEEVCEGGSDDEDDGEEEESDDDGDEEEEGEGAEEDVEDVVTMADQAEDHDGAAGDMEAELLAEKKEKARKAALKSVSVEKQKPQLPLHEDAVAHWLIKNVVRLEAAIERAWADGANEVDSSGLVVVTYQPREGKVKASVDAELAAVYATAADVNPSAWTESYAAPKALDASPLLKKMRASGDLSGFPADSLHFSSFSCILTLFLGAHEATLLDWLASSRPCFILAEIMQVPSAAATLKKIFMSNSVQALRVLSEMAEKHEGGKVLKRLIDDSG